MTRTEKWKEKREQIKEDYELEILQKIKESCKNTKSCYVCKYLKTKSCAFADLPHLWVLEDER